MADFIFTITNNIPTLKCNSALKQAKQEGNIVYEYNPLKVLRYDGESTSDIPKNSLVGLDTDKLEFDLEHPVDILTQQSYDGSVNLILNDGIHKPKLINTRFSTTGLNTYQIVDREGDNDSNIYDESTFDSEASLYKVPNSIVKLNFLGLHESGNLKVGNYVFYFKLADADGNETDIVAESGIVSCHIGGINDPFSMRGGLEDENSFKTVNFVLYNIDSSYDHVTVYYTRNSAGSEGGDITIAYKVYEKYPIFNGSAKVSITGYEQALSVSIDELNLQYNIVKSSKTQTSCQNMLFLGNVSHEDILYKDLADLSLRFCPHLNTTNDIGNVDHNYNDTTGKYEYYNVLNIYNKLGYWNDEIYRFGIVYILNDYTLSPVFNVRGIYELTSNTEYSNIPIIDENGQRKYIEIDKSNYLIYTKENSNENSKGVVRIKYNEPQFGEGKTIPIGLDFHIQNDALIELKKKTKGFFFVRQKRIKTTFAQALTIGYDKESYCPVLPISDDEYVAESFINKDKVLVHDYAQRAYKIANTYVKTGGAAICPEFELNQPYFNQFFTGTDFTVKNYKKFNTSYCNSDNRHYYCNGKLATEDSNNYNFNIIAVQDDIYGIKNKSLFYSSRAGGTEDVNKFKYIGYKNKTKDATNLLRGSFGPYIGLEGYDNLGLGLIDIKIPGYQTDLVNNYFDIRYRDNSPFQAISDRFYWDEVKNNVVKDIFRGDCYICNFTHRMIRNFQDTEAPTNDEIIEPDTWKENYSINETDSEEQRMNINRGDVNAVKIGHWVTFKCCSSINLSLRTTNPYYPTEKGLTGRVRSFYPLQAMDASGEGKIPESDLHNYGYNKSVGDKYYFETPNVPAIKNKFHTRILYSDISVNDAFRNGYRVFKGLNYRDYPLTYGSLIKMVEWYGNIICIFEHGIANIPVNERAVATQASGGNVFITTSNVLPETPNILSDMLGTQWSDSVIQTPYGIYGVDTVAKKIWKITVSKGMFQVVTISDFKVQKFLVDNITLSERETKPYLGLRNVKTHYNAYKGDIMFTFYDDINTIEENVWNLCYNEILEKFITFYSWVPSFSANIDNIFFTFDRNTSKNIAQLYNKKCNISIDLDNIDTIPRIHDESDKIIIGTLSCNIGDCTFELIEESNISPFSIISDDRGSYLEVSLDYLNNSLSVIDLTNKDENGNIIPVYSKSVLWKIPIKATQINTVNNDETSDIGIHFGKVVEDNIIIPNTSYLYGLENTYFWKHGQAGLMKTKDDIKPCNWYGKQHPFEFEIIALENPAIHKIFTDLQIISNKVSPESLHFEISGEVYNFADDKKNMFFRQEATKNIYQYYGSDIRFDSNYLKIKPEQRKIPYSKYNDKSTMFPIYYSRIDTINEIEDYYQGKSEVNKDYQRMSGSEIVYNKTTNQFNIATHVKACPFGHYYRQPISESRYNELKGLGYGNVICIGVNIETNTEEVVKNLIGTDEDINGVVTYTDGSSNYSNLKYYEIKQYGRLNGNMHYKEDSWYMQIPPIVYLQKNENDWKKNDNGLAYPPINITNNPIPEDMPLTELDSLPKDLFSLGYETDNDHFDTSIWKDRKETRIRDKYLRIKVRYTGNDLAIIYALRTMFTVSYA